VLLCSIEREAKPCGFVACISERREKKINGPHGKKKQDNSNNTIDDDGREDEEGERGPGHAVGAL
jgi:hypothetical protein